MPQRDPGIKMSCWSNSKENWNLWNLIAYKIAESIYVGIALDGCHTKIRHQCSGEHERWKMNCTAWTNENKSAGDPLSLDIGKK